jgi:hypothetical protein
LKHLILTALLLLSTKAFTKTPPSLLDPESLRGIDLTDVRIVDRHGMQTFGYMVGQTEVDDKTLQDLIETTGDDVILSKIFDLKNGEVDGKPSKFKHVYVFVSQEIVDADHSTFHMNVQYIGATSKTNLHYNITAASKDKLNLELGPTDEIQRFMAITPYHDLFPNIK